MTDLPALDVPEQPLWRRVLPFVLAAVLVGFVISRLDMATFVRELSRVSHAAFAALMISFALCLLAADTFASVVLYRITVAPIPFRDFFILRGASYLPSILNHHVGQAFLTYFLSRAYGVKLARVAGATLVVYATWAGIILVFGTTALAVGGDWKWLVITIVAGLAYLAVIHLKPKYLTDRSLLAPLFETGVAGHLIAMAARIPHFAVMFAGSWAAFELFGVRIPAQAALLYLPVLMVVQTLPITPLGIGTRDAFAGLVFAQFASGATEAERLAQVAASTLAWAIGAILIDAAIGFVLMRAASTRLRRVADAEQLGE